MATSDTITQYFTNVLQRAPSTAELDSYSALVDSGALSLAQALEAIVNSTEAQTYTAQVVRFYQAAFGRLPEAAGLDGWVDDIAAGTTTTTQLAVGFVLSPEWTARYGGTEVNSATLTGLYQNVLGRIPSGAEVDAWIATGQSLDQVFIGFANSAEFQANSNTAVNTLLTAAGNTATADIATVYDPTMSLDVTDTSGSSFVLTNGIDTFTGASGNDVFSGALNAAGAVTFQSFDTLNGGLGEDTLVVQGIGSLTTNTTTIQNIETLEIAGLTAGSTVGLANTTGLTSLKLSNPAGSSTVTGLNSGLTSVSVTGNATAGADTQTFTFSNSAVSGTSDALTVNVDGVGDSTTNDVLVVQPTSGVNGFETLTLNATGAGSFVSLNDGAATSLTTLNVTGSADIGLTVTPPTLTAYDGSAATGKQTVNLTTNTQDITVTGGAGDDDFNMSGAGVLDKNDVIDGGAGTDVLRIASANVTETDAHQVSNIETLRITDALDSNLDVTKFGSSISTVRFDADNGAARTISKLADASTLDFRAAQTGNTTAALTTTSGTSDALNINLRAALGGGGATTPNFQTVVAAGVESIAIDSGSSNTPNNAGDQNIIALTAVNLNSLTVTGNAGLNVGTLGSTVATVDSTALSPQVTGTTAGNGGLTVTLGTGANQTTTVTNGSGNDVIVSAAGSDNITTNAGVDSVTIGTGNDTVSLGSGNDTVVLATAGDLTKDDTLAGGDGTDVLQVTGTEVFVDTDFTNVSGFETFDLNGGAGSIGLNLGSKAAAAFTDGKITIDATGQTTGAINVNGASLASPAKIDVEVGAGLANDIIVGGAGDDVMNGGDNAAVGGDKLTGNGGSDTFEFQSRAEALGTVAGTDTTVNFDAITDFVAGVDVVKLGTGTNAFGGALTLTSDTVANVSSAVNVGDLANLTALAAAAETAFTGVGSTATTVQAYIYQTGADVTTATGLANKTFLIINDDTAAIAATDTFIDITGVTGTISASDFAFGTV